MRRGGLNLEMSLGAASQDPLGETYKDEGLSINRTSVVSEIYFCKSPELKSLSDIFMYISVRGIRYRDFLAKI